MYYKINKTTRYGMEIFVIAFFDANGKDISTHQYMSEQACRNKLNEIKFRRKSDKVN
jgi:hypothetical protein